MHTQISLALGKYYLPALEVMVVVFLNSGEKQG